LANKYKNNGERKSDKRKLKTDLQMYVYKAIPQGFSSTAPTRSWRFSG